MSYASRFTSNRFAALADDDNTSSPTRGAGCAAPAPAAAHQPTAVGPSEPNVRSTDAARIALSSGSDTYRPPNSIFRRGNQSDAGSMPSAFQSMRGGSTADGFTQVGGGSNGRRRYEPTPGYKGLFHKEAPPPPPKTYEEEFPSLGGPKKAAAAAAPPPPKKSGFADLAKSWAQTSAEEEAAAKVAAEKREQERRRAERDSDLYRSIFNNRLAAAAAASAAADTYDYNEEFYRNHPAGAFDEPEDDYPEHEEGRSHTPPYPPTDYPGEYEESAQPREDEW